MSESERKVNPLLAVVNTHISMIAFFAVLLAILNALWAEHEAGREAGKGARDGH